ncbi:MAG: EAL domain-containing protein [Gammaproteobacteria bacterium]|nr:MAG: EAL domain-containing protein [Gammaproteobacteria bacterium]
MSLRGKLMWTLVPVIVLPLVLVGGTAWLYVREAGTHLLMTQLEQQLQQGEQAFTGVIRTSEGTVELLAQHMLTQRYLTLPESTRLAVAYGPMVSLLNQHLSVKPQLDKLILLDHAGSIDITAENDEEAIRLGTEQLRHLYASLPARKLWLQRDTRLKLIYLVVARKIMFRQPGQDAVGQPPAFRGYVVAVARLSLDWLKGKEETDSQPLVLHLTDKNGRLLDVTLDEPGARVHQARAKKVMQNSMTRVHLFEGDEPFWGGFRRLADDLFLVGVMDVEHVRELTSPLARSLLMLALVTAAVAAVLVMVLISRHVLQPVRTMSWIIDNFRKTQSLPESVTDRQDEMGDIIRALYDLLGGLLSSYERINQLSRFDLLTGLPNRMSFTRALDEYIRQNAGRSDVIALIHLDLDGFKYVNDVHGHHVGDALLKQVAERLEMLVSHLSLRGVSSGMCQDMLARLGGNEFAVLLTELTQAHQASLAAGRIQEVMKKPFVIDEQEIMLSASMGISLYPVDGQDAEQLLKNADLALFEAKQRTRGGYQFFTSALNLSAKRRLDLERMLHEALRKHQFSMYLQPKVDLQRGMAFDFEALVRWHHPEKGVISPAQFIQVAEESGLIQELGREIIYLSCEALGKLRTLQQNPNLRMSVNLSPLQFRDPSLIDFIQETAAHFGLHPRDLEFEVTESVMLEDQDHAFLMVNDLRALGASISLDDFGTGYSSLSYLRRFPFDTVKIDRSFVMELDESDEAAHIIASITRLIMDLDKKVVAEGVETPTQLARLRQCGVELAQGYLFSRPVPVEEVQCDFRSVVFEHPVSDGQQEL